MTSAIRNHIRCSAIILLIVSLFASLYFTGLNFRQVDAQTTHEVKIFDFAFVPQNLTINLGDTIMWNNTDPVIHTLWFVFVSNQTTYLLSDPIPPDSTWAHSFNDAVELQYFSFDKLWITGFINIAAGAKDVAIIDTVTSKNGCLPMQTVGQGFTVNITVTVENQGDFTETFDVTTYANTTAIGTLPITLNTAESKTLCFIWNTTGFIKGNYTISATAETLPGELDIADNTLINGKILVTTPGDINGDTYVNIKDAVLLGVAFGSALEDPNYNPNADLNNDGFINIKDAVILGVHFGEH